MRNGKDKVKKEEEAQEEEDLFWGSDSDDGSQYEDNIPVPTISKKNMLHFGEILTAPIPVRYSCEALTKMIEKGDIDLEPEYQRGVVWKTEKQSAVIDSIFRNCYVPPLLFSIHIETNEDGDPSEKRICVDGKQRLSSIHMFMNNKIPLREPVSGRAFWYNYKPSRGHTRFLTDKQRDKFASIQINCVEYHGLDEERERDMFQRVQMGVTLTPSEKLSANLGPWPDFLRELVKRFVENEEFNLRHVLKMDRGKDFMYMGMIMLLILHCDEKVFVPSSGNLLKFFKTAAPPADTQKKQIVAAMAKFTALANDDSSNEPLLPIARYRLASKSISPMEFLFSAYICFRFPQATNKQLSELIAGMLRRVRGEHSDIMINPKNEKTIRTYIHEMESLHPFWMSADSSGRGRKRRREAEAVGDEEEYVPPVDQVLAVRARQNDYLAE